MKNLIKKHEDKIRFLLAGGWNTIFGYFSFVFLYLLLSPKIHYMVILILSNILAISNAFISYKLFVFRTKGNIIKEYIRFYLVYGVSILISLVLMPTLVEICRIHPLISQAIIIVFTVIISFIGHKYFSFRVEHGTA